MEEVVKFEVPRISPEEAKERGLLKIMDSGNDGTASRAWDAGCYVDPEKVAAFQRKAGMTVSKRSG